MSIDLSFLDGALSGITLHGIVSAVINLVICLIVIRILTSLARRAIRHTQLDDRLQRFFMTGLRTLLYVVTVIIVAQSLGIPSSSLIALLGVASLAISLAIQGMLSNLAGGIMLLTSRPIVLGDLAEIAGVTGVVDEIGLMYTKLHTADGQIIMLPNSSISSEKITNYTTLGQRRITVTVGASYDAPTADVRAALLEAAANTEHLLSDPAPAAYVNAYLDSSIEYVLYAWSTADDYWVTHFILTEAVKTSFDRHGIEIPYNHLNVHIMNDGSLQTRTAQSSSQK